MVYYGAVWEEEGGKKTEYSDWAGAVLGVLPSRVRPIRARLLLPSLFFPANSVIHYSYPYNLYIHEFSLFKSIVLGTNLL